MKTTTIEITKLTASDGMMLTNGEMYGIEAYLSVNDSPDNWHEISVEEYERIMAEQEIKVE